MWSTNVQRSATYVATPPQQALIIKGSTKRLFILRDEHVYFVKTRPSLIYTEIAYPMQNYPVERTTNVLQKHIRIHVRKYSPYTVYNKTVRGGCCTKSVFFPWIFTTAFFKRSIDTLILWWLWFFFSARLSYCGKKNKNSNHYQTPPLPSLENWLNKNVWMKLRARCL